MRGFLNEFDTNGGRESKTLETIQFSVCEQPPDVKDSLLAASRLVQVSGKCRPRLHEVD